MGIFHFASDVNVTVLAQATEPPAKLVTKASTASETPQPPPTPLGGSAAFCKSCADLGRSAPQGNEAHWGMTQRSGLHPRLSLRPSIWAQSPSVLAVEI